MADSTGKKGEKQSEKNISKFIPRLINKIKISII